jgi:beta-galactosidase
MPKNLTRRDFITDASLVASASALNLEAFAAPKPIPQPPLERRANFDAGWKFFNGDTPGADAPAFQDTTWTTLNLPHDWSIEGAFSEDAPAKGEGAYLPTGIGWYRKQFTLPATTTGKRVAIEFDGVYQRSEVWINGKPLGMRPYGFITFAYDLTPHLNPPGKPNLLAVKVDNSLQPNCRWYTGSGIYRHTWLRITELTYIAQWSTFVQASQNTELNLAEVLVISTVMNLDSNDPAYELTVEILDPTGVVVPIQNTAGATVQHITYSTYSVPRNGPQPPGERALMTPLRIVSPTLWSPANPHLYTARTTLRHAGRLVDQETTPFGIRTVEFDVDKGFLLNGEHIKLNGVCIHGDGGSVGTAVPERVWERRLELLQQMGCNSIRLSHNPPAPELLDMLDRMGFLVMDEAFDEWRDGKAQLKGNGYAKYFDEWSERDLTAMIERDRNHPCIVIWSAGNEIRDQTDPRGPATLQRLKDIIHKSDTTRLITAACDEIASDPRPASPEFLAGLDVVGYNYVDRWRDRREKFYSIDRHDYPARKFIGTETSALGGVRGSYAVDPASPQFERAMNTLIEVEQLQKFIQTYDYVSGDFMWTGIDYLGEARWPNKNASSGFLDTCGFEKASYYFYQSIWTQKPMVHLATHWNWQGREGQLIPVTCFTNCDTVELFLNGKSLGSKGYAFPRPGMVERYGNYPARARALQTTADLHLSWDVPYAPGTLTAKGTKDSAVIQTAEIHTTGAPAKLALTADRSAIRTSPGDVAHITVQVLDAEGHMVPTAADQITFTLEGEGRILGLDNGQPDSHESFKGNTRKAFNGLALVILQSTGRRGAMTLSASAPSLTSAQIKINAS